MSDKAWCLNCKFRIGYPAYRGLCRLCYGTPEVRALFPSDGEPTAEEVERTVEQQRRCLPPWWHETDPEGDE